MKKFQCPNCENIAEFADNYTAHDLWNHPQTDRACAFSCSTFNSDVESRMIPRCNCEFDGSGYGILYRMIEV